MKEKTFYHPGKLLLSGEYLILDGALGLALPTKKGQYLIAKEIENATRKLHWKSFDEKKSLWFEAIFELPSLQIIFCSNKSKGLYLQRLLKTSMELSTDFLKAPKGLLIETYLEFSPHWGLGSSSTLICNLARLAQIDPYKLLWNTTDKASAYDVACAIEKNPILYRVENKIPQIKKIDFWPSFKDQLFFLYLNKKQNTKKSIDFYKKKKIKSSEIKEISIISEKLIQCRDLEEFENLLELHEAILSILLKIPKVKEKFFPNYQGAIKSLGAWGGDFSLVSYREGMRCYFLEKGFPLLIPFEEMILKN